MAMTYYKDSKKVEDYNVSIEEFKRALLIAPWWPDANKVKAYAENLHQLVAQEGFNAYVESLKQKASIKIVKANLEKTER